MGLQNKCYKILKFVNSKKVSKHAKNKITSSGLTPLEKPDRFYPSNDGLKSNLKEKDKIY